MMALYGLYQERRLEEMKILALMHGAKIEEDVESPVSPEATVKTPGEDAFLFKDASAYAHLSKEEREDLTERMMGAHKGFARNKLSKQLGTT